MGHQREFRNKVVFDTMTSAFNNIKGTLKGIAKSLEEVLHNDPEEG